MEVVIEGFIIPEKGEEVIRLAEIVRSELDMSRQNEGVMFILRVEGAEIPYTNYITP